MLVEIWSDIVCPWCAIGKARFEQAMASFEHADDVEVVWRSFELDTNAPKVMTEGLAEHLAHKYGTDLAQAQGMMDNMTQTAAQEGLEFNFDVARPGNTFDAHRLLHLAKDRGLQHELKERLFTAYLTEGRAIADVEVLQAIAVEAGLDEVEAKEVLVGDAYGAQVRQDQAKAMEYGIRGVPFYVVDQKYGVSGAQPAPALVQVLQTAWAEANPSPLTMVEGDPDAEACVDGVCDV